MSKSPSKPRPPRSTWLLRRADQAAVASLLAAGLVAIVGWWVSQGGLQHRLIEVDRAETKPIHFQVDINTAAWPELVQLPNVGPTLAQRIVESREREGPFRDHEDLRRVRGIGPRTLEAIRPFLRPVPPRGHIAER